MNGMNNVNLQNNVTEEIILNLKTQNCQFIQSKFYGTQYSVNWKTFLEELIEKQIIYYIDIEKFLKEANIDHICEKLIQADSYSFQFRVNYGQQFEWFTVTAIANEKLSDKPISLKIIVQNQNTLDRRQIEANQEFLKELLLNGFGEVYSNIIWVDVNNDSYKMLNGFGNILDIESNVDPVGTYTTDNKGYAINCVYEEDRDTFYQYTSLQWYKEHLKTKGDNFSFLIRHIYNGEYRWVEVNTVCTKRDSEFFHVLYWVDDVNDKVYDNTAMKDTLTSVEVGQWRYEIKNGSEGKLTASPSLKRILGLKNTNGDEASLDDLKEKIWMEDRGKVTETIFDLTENEETSFSFRIKNKKGLRYYRCGVTCVAKNNIYTCYQGYMQDVTDIMQPMVTSIKHAEELSFTDKLTGLHNRNYMESRCESFMRKDELPVSLIMADCNYLKHTNDTLGHEYGDLLLQRVAKSIQECLPENCVAMRVGGDEFLIMCACCSVENVTRIVDSIRKKLKEHSDEVLKLSASFGTCTVETSDISFQDAYNIADRVMYEEKQQHHKRNLISKEREHFHE